MTQPHRQAYGLGSIIKKITKPIKKIAKSPLGKAALLGGGLWGLGKIGGIGSSGIGKNWWSKGMGLGKNLLLGKATGQGAAGQTMPRSGGIWNWIKGNPGKAAFLGAGTAATLLPFMGVGEEDEVIEEGFDVTPSSIANIRQMARDRHPSLMFLPKSDYVQEGFFTGAKDGGLIGLANGGQPAQAQAEQMLRMEYQKYRNQGGTMSYQQFKMAVLQQAQGQGPMAQKRGRVDGPGGYAGWKTSQPDLSYEDALKFSMPGAKRISDGRIISPAQGDFSWILELMRRNRAEGGRIGYQGGELVTDESMMAETPTGMMEENIEEVQGEPTREQLEVLSMEIFQLRLEELDEEQLMVVYQAAMQQQPEAMAMQAADVQMAAQGGRIGLLGGGPVPGSQVAGYTTPVGYNKYDYRTGGVPVRVGAADGGIMPLLDLGGKEKDYRQDGGFVGIGRKERADDVPARLSKNEFVFTADAVRNAGGGDVDAGAEVMENMMNHLEAGGQISEESQGLGAQGMYDNMRQLETRME